MKKISFVFTTGILIALFSLTAAQVYAANSVPSVGAITPSSGTSDPNQEVTFTTTCIDPDGWQNIKYISLLIHTVIRGGEGFYGHYNQDTNKLYLRNDSGGGWLGGFTPGSNNVIENSYAKLNCASTTVSNSGTTITIKWAITFKSVFAGTKNAYLAVGDEANGNSGWIKKGTWTITNKAPLAGIITPSSGTSDPDQVVTFTTTYIDPDGWQNTRYINLLINTAVRGAESFYGYYNQDTNKLYLRNDSNNTWLGGFTPGSNNVIENSYAKLNCASTTVSGSGTTITIKWAVIFKPVFSGTKNIYLYVGDDAGANSGWIKKGTWTITNRAPSVGPITPSSGTSDPNQAVTFTTTYSDPDGWQNTRYIDLLINTAVRGAESFYGYYNQDTNKLYLRNDSNNTWLGGFTPGSNNVIENSYAKLNCASTTVSGSGTTITIKWAVTFKPVFSGTKNTYLYVVDEAGGSSGWIKKGTWTIGVPPNILTTNLPDAIAGQDYSEFLNAVDGVSPYVWSIDSGNLPDGLILDSTTGEISGKPKVSGICNFTVRVMDSNMMLATKALSINVLPVSMDPDERLLDDTEAKATLYFYNEALSNGFVKDGNHKDFSSIAATGFGLTSLCIMTERYGTTAGWMITPEQARVRVNQILDNCINYQNMQTAEGNEYGIAGFLYHFITEDGARQGSSEISTVDMALFLAGAITAGEYFGGEIKAKVGQICDKVNWNYFYVPASKRFSHGSQYAGAGVMPNTWDRPGDEAMIVSLIALASNPENSNFLRTMYSWPRAERQYGGYKVVNSYFGSLFTYIFAHCYFDFEKLGVDNPLLVVSPAKPVDWWVNSVNAVKAARQFCIDQSANYLSYGEDSWGISACEYPTGGYAGLLGAAPCEANSASPVHDGTIAPYAAISCLPFMRTSLTENLGDNLAFKALKYFYDTYYNNLWGPYGPRESFNQNGEFNSYYYGLNLGSIVLMIENYRSRFIWDTFMKNDKIKAATAKVFGQSDFPPVKTLYVNAANAADLNQDGSQAHPFSAIQKAIDDGGSNSSINIAPGKYAEAINIVSKLRVVLKGTLVNRSEPTSIQSNTVIVKGGNASPAVTIDESGEITIDGVVITGDGGHDSNTISGIYARNSNAVTIKNTVIQEAGNQVSYTERNMGGIASVGNANVVIMDNVIRNNQGYHSAGIYVTGVGAKGEVTILRNDVIGNYAYAGSGGIYVTGISNVSIKNNRIYNSQSIWYGPNGAEIPGGLTVHDATGGGEINNNLLIGSSVDHVGGYRYGGYGINCYNSNVVVANNIIENGNGISTSGGSPIVKNNMVAGMYGFYPEDPLFVARDNGDGDPYNDDYHLQPFSPLINAGDPDPAFNDKDGTRNDIGLYGGPDADVPDPNVLMVPQDYSTIQAAIDSAVKGDVIKVAAGTYTENITLDKSGIILLGSDRNSVIRAPSSSTAVYCEDITGDMTLISGFTIQGRYGVKCAGSINSLRIEDNNISVADAGSVDYGYGIYMEDGVSLFIARNNITRCGRAIHGAGNNIARIAGNNIDNCRMPGGGGIFLNGSTNWNIVTIIGNSISHCLDGAIRSRDRTSIQVINNRITNNDASSGTAVIECIDARATLYNNFIGYNSASGSGNSGVAIKKISYSYTSAYLSNNIFYRNVGTNAPGAGSAISLYDIPSQSSYMMNNIFVGNSNAAAVVFSDWGSSQFTYNDVWNNTCQNDTVGVASYDSISADPLFVSATDFHLGSGSPCIDSGWDSYDKDVDGTRIDMGIYGGPYPMPDAK